MITCSPTFKTGILDYLFKYSAFIFLSLSIYRFIDLCLVNFLTTLLLSHTASPQTSHAGCFLVLQASAALNSDLGASKEKNVGSDFWDLHFLPASYRKPATLSGRMLLPHVLKNHRKFRAKNSLSSCEQSVFDLSPNESSLLLWMCLYSYSSITISLSTHSRNGWRRWFRNKILWRFSHQLSHLATKTR